MNNTAPADSKPALTALQRLLLWVFLRFLFFRRKHYEKLSRLADTACFVEAWDKITDGKPVDIESPFFKQLNAAITYYLNRPIFYRDALGILECQILPYGALYWELRERYKKEAASHFRFVLQHRLARIFRKYRNTAMAINLRATEDIASFERSSQLEPSAAYWKSRVVSELLPLKIRNAKSSRPIGRYLKSAVRQAKRTLARKNYYKVDFSTSDITAFIALSGTLLLLLGYVQIAAVHLYFGIPYQRYFGTSDYVASSINSVDKYLLSALVSAVAAYVSVSTIHSYSLPSDRIKTPISDRIISWMYHAMGVSSILVLVFSFLTTKRIDTLLLAVACTYVGIYIIANVSLRFFVNPFKAYLFLCLILSAAVNAAAGTIGEINRIVASQAGSPVRVLKFVDNSYVEPDWNVLAITKEFVILRRRSDGFIQVRNKSDLRSIDDVIEKTKSD
jgi:hypothetical protein